MIPMQIVVAVAAVLGAILRTLVPGFPLTDEQIVMLAVALLGAIGVVVQLRYGLVRGLTGTDGWLRSKAFWLLVAGVANIVLKAYLPTFPLLEADIAAVLFWALAQFGINPEVREKAMRLLKKQIV